MNWYVLYTKSRYEKAVAEKLTLSGIEAYCPVLKLKKKWSDRWKWVEEPLFRSYCFVYIAEAEREKVFSAAGVVRYLCYCGKPAIVREREIGLLKNWLEEYEHDSIDVGSLKVNDRIVIRSGALIDKSAKVMESRGHYALLYLESIGMQVKVDLRKNIIEKLTAS